MHIFSRLLNSLKAHGGNVILFALVAFLLWRQAPLWWANKKMEGVLVSQASVQNDSGQSHLLPDHSAAVYLFWATWCTPCHVEMEHFRKAVDNGELPAARIFAINMGEEHSIAKTFWSKEKYPFQLIFDDKEALIRQFEVAVTPTVAFVDASGKISEVSSGVSLLNVSRAKKILK